MHELITAAEAWMSVVSWTAQISPQINFKWLRVQLQRQNYNAHM